MRVFKQLLLFVLGLGAAQALASCEELKIESFDVAFTNWCFGSAFEWDYRGRIDECPSCSNYLGITSIDMAPTTDRMRKLLQEFRCPFCEEKLPIAKNLEEYDYMMRSNKQNRCYLYHYKLVETVRVHFTISLPYDWLPSKPWSPDGNSYLEECGLGIEVTDEIGHPWVLLCGVSADDNTSFVGRNPNSLVREKRYRCQGQGYNGGSCEVVDITPADYSPLRRLLDIQVEYAIQVNCGNLGVPEPMSFPGQELKQSFYRVTYQANTDD